MNALKIGKTNFYITSNNIYEDISKIERILNEPDKNFVFQKYICEIYYQIGVVYFSEIENYGENETRYSNMLRGNDLIKLEMIYSFYDSNSGDEMEAKLIEIFSGILPESGFVAPTTIVGNEVDIYGYRNTGLSCEQQYNFYQISYYNIDRKDLKENFKNEIEEYRSQRLEETKIFYWISEEDDEIAETKFLILNIITDFNEEEVSGIIPFIDKIKDVNSMKVETSAAELLSTYNKGEYELAEVRGGGIISGYKNIRFNKNREIEDLYSAFGNVKIY